MALRRINKEISTVITWTYDDSDPEDFQWAEGMKQLTLPEFVQIATEGSTIGDQSWKLVREWEEAVDFSKEED